MFIKRRAKEDSFKNIRYLNGTVSFQQVRLNVYCYEVDGVLIDTSSYTLINEFQSFIEKANIEQVVITHYHEDHTGGAGYLQKKYGYPIYMNELTIPDCAKEANYPLYRQLFWGKRKPFQAQAIRDTFSSRNATWDVIHTPGHAKDHLAFLNRETGQLFSGDLYVSPKTKVVLREENIPQIIASLEKVLSYDFEELFCSHAGYVKNGRKAISNKLEYLKELQDHVLSLYEKGYSVKEIQKQLFPKKYPITFFSRGEWNSLHIIRSIIYEVNKVVTT